MYIIYKFLNAAQRQHQTRIGSFMEYEIAHIEDQLEPFVDLEGLDATVITEAVAKALPFLYVGWKGTIKVKSGSLADQLGVEDLVGSTEEGSVYVHHTITDTEKANTVELGKVILRKRLNEIYIEKFKKLNLQPDMLELATWDQQKTEAAMYEVDNSADVPMLTALAAARGITLSAMATLVNNAVDAYNTSISSLLAARQGVEQTIKGMTEIGDFNVLLHTKFGVTMSEAQMEATGVSTPAAITV
jgi:hypothetical protein